MNSTTSTSFIQFLQEVQRSQTDRKLGGVCGGLGAHSNMPSWVFRACFIALLATGLAPLAYIALWICMPAEPALQLATHPADEKGHPAPAH